jgi:hypothetical protein
MIPFHYSTVLSDIAFRHGASDARLATALTACSTRHRRHLRLLGRGFARTSSHGPRSRRCVGRRPHTVGGTGHSARRRRPASGRTRVDTAVWPRARRPAVVTRISRHTGRRAVGVAHRASALSWRFGYPFLVADLRIWAPTLFSTATRASQVSLIAFNVQLDAPAATGVAHALTGLLVASAVNRVDVVAATSTRSMAQRADAWHAAPMRCTTEQHAGMRAHLLEMYGVQT